VNLKQLAGMLSLSQTTVSRALNGYPEVAEETRRRVIAAAKRHGYRPNPSARRLATGKAGMIGYVMPTGASVDIDPHFVEFLSGLGDYARSHELDLTLSPTTIEDEETTYRRVVANKQVDAVYVSAPLEKDRRIGLLESYGFPYIVHGRSEGLEFDYPFIDIDNEGAFHDAARLMAQFGHSRVALVNGDASVAMTEENGYRAARALLDRDDRPTAILCSSLHLALGIVRATRDLDLSVPGDVSLIAHDDVFPFLKPEGFPVALTTTRSPIRAAGARVAERLAARIAGIENEPRGEVWRVDLIMRGSVAPAPALEKAG
jgi:LacI family transcriptional regulator